MDEDGNDVAITNADGSEEEDSDSQEEDNDAEADGQHCHFHAGVEYVLNHQTCHFLVLDLILLTSKLSIGIV